MSQPCVLILRAPGTNCDGETAYAFERAGAAVEKLHINRVLENSRRLDKFQILCLPGGFSYGDDLAAGRILAGQIRSRLAECLDGFRAADKLILGICNGFQVLIQSGILLDGASTAGRQAPVATLTGNQSGKFEDRWVRLRTDGRKCVFLTGVDSMYLPVAHAEGKFVVQDAGVLAALEANEQLALRYASLTAPAASTGSTVKQPSGIAYPDNPNGSMADVAGICDTTGRVCGLMPHPERHIDPWQHPRWTRGEAAGEGDGLQVFRNAVEYFS